MDGLIASHRSRSSARGLALLLVAAVTGAALAPVAAASPPPVRGERGMAVTPEARASLAADSVLRSGGNAVDAAVAAAFVLAVTYPLGGNLGGGGFLLYRAGPDEHHALDFRETAPAGTEPALYQDADGRPRPRAGLEGGTAVGVPGSVAGLAEAHRRWGSKPWATLLAPAIVAAGEGFEVYPFLARAFEREIDKLRADPEARRIFTRDGAPLRSGDTLVQSDLAATLRRIAADGPVAFYEGAVAHAVAERVRAAGGVMSVDDLAAYRPLERQPLTGRYRGHRVVAFPPPSSGGVALLQILGMLERYDLASEGFGSSAITHLIAEAERRAFADRSRWLGDPGFFDVPVERLLARDYLAHRAGSIVANRATASATLAPGQPLERSAGAGRGETLHLSVADARGGAVALTTTLNGWFGSGIVAPGTGVLLNNEMDDFALAPDAPNLYGLIGGEANAVRAGKRPLSSMAPTIVELPRPGPRPALVLGGPGGPTIITSVAQVLVNVVDHGMSIQEAVDAPRFHHQWLPDEILHETRAFPADVARALAARGHALREAPTPIGNVNAIAVDADGAWLGAADPRRRGLAVGH